ncbi:MAG: 50S ribosomal protein L23 [Patescibacteria group bacterium]
MALLDIFKNKRTKADDKLKRPSKGVLKSSEKKTVEKKTVVKGEKKVKSESKEKDSELASMVILSPHVTEKSTFLSEKNVYAFKITPSANKIIVKRAIKEMYGFDPLKVSIVNMPAKTKRLRGKRGVKPGYKKALVYLREDNKIDLV